MLKAMRKPCINTITDRTAAPIADTIIAMKQGEIAMIGSPEEIITEENLKTIFNLDAEVITHAGKRLVIHHI